MSSSKAPVVALEAKRAEILASMTEATQKVVEEFRRNELRYVKGSILTFYNMGVRVLDMLSHQDKYGANAVPQIAAYFGKDKQRFFDMRNVVQAYTKEEVEKLCERTMSSGGIVTFTHLAQLARINSERDRKRLTDRVFTESLSSNEVETEISAKLDKRHVRHGGRRPAKPRNSMAGLQQVFSRAQQLNNRFEIWEDSVFTPIEEIDAPSATGVMLKLLEKAEAELETLRGHVEKSEPRMKKSLERVRKIIEDKKSKKSDKTGKSSEKDAEDVETEPADEPVAA